MRNFNRARDDPSRRFYHFVGNDGCSLQEYLLFAILIKSFARSFKREYINFHYFRSVKLYVDTWKDTGRIRTIIFRIRVMRRMNVYCTCE